MKPLVPDDLVGSYTGGAGFTRLIALSSDGQYEDVTVSRALAGSQSYRGTWRLRGPAAVELHATWMESERDYDDGMRSSSSSCDSTHLLAVQRDGDGRVVGVRDDTTLLERTNR